MGRLCRSSQLVIPNDPAFGPAAAGFVVEVARLIGFEGQDLLSIAQGVQKAVENVIRYSFEPGERADLTLTCDHNPEGLQVRLQDKGLPFGSAELSPAGQVCPPGSGSEFCAGILGLKEFDEVRLHSLGPGGKETVLIKHLKTAAFAEDRQACDLLPAMDPVLPPEKVQWSVRQVRPEETPEISRLVYEAYGYTYSHEYVYYPQRIVALNEAGRIHSAVAIAEGKEIAGHCTLRFPEGHPHIAELAQAVVKPEYRSRGCLRVLTEYLLQVAQEMGFRGVFTKPVTEHPFSQRTAYRFGFKDCAVLLGIIPKDTPFKGFAGPLPHRGSLLLQFRYLEHVPTGISFAPPRHRDMISRILEDMGIAQEVRSEVSSGPGDGGSILKTHTVRLNQFARMVIERSGPDVVDQVRTELRELIIRKVEVVQLYLNLGDPQTIPLSGEFEQLGFFFAGLLPEAFPDGHGLILQFLNNAEIRYEAVMVESRTARELLSYVQANDPNQE
jgi:serine/threonine-protein kinase RsbW